jgi:hypothetical protein
MRNFLIKILVVRNSYQQAREENSAINAEIYLNLYQAQFTQRKSPSDWIFWINCLFIGRFCEEKGIDLLNNAAINRNLSYQKINC